MFKKVYYWTGSLVHTLYGVPFLFLLFFIEAIIFPLPTDPVLLVFCLEQQRKAFFYAAIATIASVFGGVCAYFIGMLLWDVVGKKLLLYVATPETFNKLIYTYKQYQHSAVLLGAFTPIPYKLITLTAGFCQLNLNKFILFSLIGRGLRFFLISLLAVLFGQKIKHFIELYFNYLIILCTLIIGSILFLYK